MKFEEYQKPDLEELEIILEGHFDNDTTDPDNPGVDVGGPGDGDAD